MKKNKPLLLGLWLLVTVAAIGVAWQQFWKASRLATMLAGSNLAELQERLAATERRNRTLESQLAVRGETAADGAAAENPTASARNANQGGRGPRGDFAAMLDRPEMVRLRALQQRAALDTRFAPLFKALNLSPEKLNQFKDLLAERESTMQDMMMAAREQGIDPRTNPEEFRKLVASAQAESDAQLKSLLGDDGYAQYQQYAATQPQRATVDQLRTSLSYTSDPLSDTQAAQLLQILATTAPAAPNGPPPDGGGRGPGGPFGGGGGATITTETLTQAQTVLSTAQLTALQQMQSLQQAQQQAMQSLRNNGDTAAPTPDRRNPGRS